MDNEHFYYLSDMLLLESSRCFMGIGYLCIV